jgi:hypothetical protein
VGLGEKRLIFGLESPETTVAPPPTAISGDGGLEREQSVREEEEKYFLCVKRKQVYTSSVLN